MLNVWEGIYPSFALAPAVGPGFSGLRWKEASLQLARETLDKAARGAALDYSLLQRNAVLPSVVAGLLSRESGLRILDIGGGVGTGYVVLQRALAHRRGQVVYDILEVDEICKAGERLFHGREGPGFLKEMPRQEHSYDIIYMASALQYVEDWKGLLAALANLRAGHVLLSDMLVGKAASFVSLQNYYENKITCWFINESELMDQLEIGGYRLTLRFPCLPKVLGKVDDLPMSNFPSDCRIKHSWHFLFERTSHSKRSGS